MLLWILFAILTAGALGAVFSPLFRQPEVNESRDLYDVAVYKDQLKEIDQDIDRGLISEQEARTAKTEISRRLLKSAEKLEKNTSSGKTGNIPPKSAIFASLILVPVLSLGMYIRFGYPTPPAPLTCIQQASRFEQTKELTHVLELVGKAEAQLKKKPDDARGWFVLAPIYLKLQCYQESANAYKKVMELKGVNGKLLAEYGEALVRANKSVITPEARAAFRKSLELQPDRMLPRIRLIMALEQDGKNEEAAKAWAKIYEEKDSSIPLKRMAQMRYKALTGKELDGGVKQAQKKEDTLGNPSSEDIKAAGEMSAEDRGAMIQNMVTGLAERLSEKGGTLQEWMRLIRAYNVLGKKDQALKALKDAKENLKSNADDIKKLDQFASQLGLKS